MAVSGTLASVDAATTLAAIAQVDERFAWTGGLIDAVLALRFKDPVVAGAIDSAKGNEAKRKAWSALAARLHALHGVLVPETKIRRAISKWQSQHRSWAQTMATKDPAKLTQADRPPTYMPVLQRYFQEEMGSSSVEKQADVAVVPQVASPRASGPLGLMGFEAALNEIPSPPPNAVAEGEVLTMSTSISTPPIARLGSPVLARTELARATAQYAVAAVPPPPTARLASPMLMIQKDLAAVTPARLPAPSPVLVPQDTDEDPGTSQEDIPARFQEVPVAKRKKVSPQKTVVVPIRPTRVASMPTSIPATRPAISAVRATSVGGSAELKEMASRVTKQIASVQQEHMVLQKKHFEEQLELQRKQYEEQFAIQRKHVDVVQAVLESLHGSIAFDAQF